MEIFHKWGKWQQIDRGDVWRKHPVTSEDMLVGKFVVMKRECDTCGKPQIKKFTS